MKMFSSITKSEILFSKLNFVLKCVEHQFRVSYDFKAFLTYFVHLDISRNPDTGIDGFLCRTVCCFLLLL